jgi:hypothetical protein
MAAPRPANACPEGFGTIRVRKGDDDQTPQARSHLVERPAERNGKRHCRERGLSQEPLQILPHGGTIRRCGQRRSRVRFLVGDWRGWDGTRAWDAVEHGMTIEASHRGSRVESLFILRRHYDSDAWELRIPIRVAPGRDAAEPCRGDGQGGSTRGASLTHGRSEARVSCRSTTAETTATSSDIPGHWPRRARLSRSIGKAARVLVALHPRRRHGLDATSRSG